MTIVEYNSKWTEYFQQIENILKSNLSKYAKIEHIGSTAITGMWAKPIIDIVIVINSPEDFIETKNELEKIGYSHHGDQGIIGREVFKRNINFQNEILDNISHHLYVCTIDNEEYKRHTLFRNYLNKHEKARNEYNNIKKEIIHKIGNEDRKEYVSIKATQYNWFFEKVLKEANEEEKLILGKYQSKTI